MFARSCSQLITSVSLTNNSCTISIFLLWTVTYHVDSSPGVAVWLTSTLGSVQCHVVLTSAGRPLVIMTMCRGTGFRNLIPHVSMERG